MNVKLLTVTKLKRGCTCQNATDCWKSHALAHMKPAAGLHHLVRETGDSSIITGRIGCCSRRTDDGSP